MFASRVNVSFGNQLTSQIFVLPNIDFFLVSNFQHNVTLGICGLEVVLLPRVKQVFFTRHNTSHENFENATSLSDAMFLITMYTVIIIKKQQLYTHSIFLEKFLFFPSHYSGNPDIEFPFTLSQYPSHSRYHNIPHV